MGGKALQNTSPRLDATDYYPFAARTVALLRLAAPESRIEVIPAYALKPSFGDLDLVVDWGREPEASAQRAAALQALAPTEVSVDHDVTSVGVPANLHAAPFQLDLICAPGGYFDFTLSFFSFNDLGNLLARVAHAAGFKLDDRGLRHVVRVPYSQHVLAELVVTLDWSQALQFLGYDPQAYAAGAAGGFQSLEDIFRFVLSSPDVHLPSYQPRYMNHAARRRDSKRKTYRAFLAWLDQLDDTRVHGARLGQEERQTRCAHYLERALTMFPHFKAAYEETVERARLVRLAKARLNAKVAQKHTGAWGKELENIMQRINQIHPDAEARTAWICNASDADLHALIEASAQEVRQRHRVHLEETSSS